MKYTAPNIDDAIHKAKFTDFTEFDLSQIESRPELRKFLQFCQNLTQNGVINTLTLNDKVLSNDHIAYLVINLNKIPNLRSLYLKNTSLADLEAEKLAELENVIALDLSDNAITDSGAIAIAQNHQFQNLNLNNNQIGNDGAEEFLATVKTNPALRNLNLEGNSDIDPQILVKIQDQLISNDTKPNSAAMAPAASAAAGPNITDLKL